MRGLIGHTGFVGSNILEQSSFDKCYNSKNIESIAGEKFDILVGAGVSSIKWKANKEPKEDFKQIKKLIQSLDQSEFQTLVLISTIAVYDNPADSAYGRHRLYLETYLMNKYDNVYITRLPSLFGKGLKKNAIYDLMNKDYRFVPDPWSYFQYYCLDHIWKDIEKQIDLDIKILNINSERVPFDKVLDLFELNLEQFRGNTVVHENMLSDHGAHWGQAGSYLYTQEETLQQLKEFITRNE